MLNLFPAFLKLEARRVVVVGGGRVAASKLDALLDAGAHVTVVAPAVTRAIKERDVTVVERAFVDSDLDGAWWVVAAAPPDVNRAVGAAAESRRVFVNAVDDPRHATAYLGGVVRRDDVTVAISTNGRAPALAGLLREALDAWLPADLSRWLAVSDRARREWKRAGTPMEQRRGLLLGILNRIYAGRPDRLRQGYGGPPKLQAKAEGRPLQGEALQGRPLHGPPVEGRPLHGPTPENREDQEIECR